MDSVSNAATQANVLNGFTGNGFQIGEYQSLSQTGKLLPLGDSITVGAAGSPPIDPSLFAYRDHLQYYMGVGNFDFVGSQQSPSSDPVYDVDNSGVSGNTLAQISTRLSSDLTTYLALPNTNSIILLHGGTNDVLNSVPLATSLATVATMMTNINTHDPNIKVYVALIIPINNVQNADVITFNAALLSQMNTWISTHPNVHTVDMYTALTDQCVPLSNCIGLADGGLGVHPNDTGFTIMAQTWYKCLLSSNNHYCDGH